MIVSWKNWYTICIIRKEMYICTENLLGEKYNDEQINDIMTFNEGYKNYITKGKNKNSYVSVKLLNWQWHMDIKRLNEVDILKPGDKVYVTNMKKILLYLLLGKTLLEDGMRILGAHIDSPRMDLKQNPLYESEGFAMLDTHYCGGVKKYQWVTIPLSMVGVVVKRWYCDKCKYW